ncbi:MAG: hypothetical protein GWN01_01880 [Nitrosopumilaceae archaeon]|nr:hypothetical protein [Nitrosopumilaceae archaeon]NIT99722.1 hypothetical protein [Nitrosopumilaceae archaeon]NIU88583.1 hypothetical protein [Nitrosopumilaceae archaeon]NIV64857.1 hypothetical protein [Nitrosopumilaceae archaeon]NIX60325.1 hypothetical protein [Nitrosopumilaceae archaeon]
MRVSFIGWLRSHRRFSKRIDGFLTYWDNNTNLDGRLRYPGIKNHLQKYRPDLVEDFEILYSQWKEESKQLVVINSRGCRI